MAAPGNTGKSREEVFLKILEDLEALRRSIADGTCEADGEWTPEFIDRMEKSVRSVLAGRVIPHEQVMAEMKEWLRNRKAQSERNESVDEPSK